VDGPSAYLPSREGTSQRPFDWWALPGRLSVMSMMKRISTIFRAKANSALDKAEDPRQTLDYSYQRQLEMLTKVRRGVADVATSRKRVELQMNQLQAQSDKLTAQAQQALSMGREDLAREALTRKSALTQQLTDLQTQHAQLQGEEEKLTLASQRLQAKVESFRTRKETIKATYTAAEAQTRINEAFSGISEEMGDVGMAIQRAEDKTLQMQARAGAVDELIASGALEDASSTSGGDDISRELEAMSSQSDVEAELAALKGSTPQAISAPEDTPQITTETPAQDPTQAAAESVAKTEGQSVEKEG
jgi:phage shock protein A